MADVRPERRPTPVELEFQYDVSDSYIERQIIDTGREPAKRWTVTFKLTEVDDPQLRQQLRDAHQLYMDVPWYVVLEQPTDDPAHIAAAIITREATGSAFDDADPLTRAYVNDMKAWVSTHGSQRLQRSLARGYESNRLYVQERARSELPGFWSDIGDQGEWRERANPSEEALDYEDSVHAMLSSMYGENHGLTVRIVWLSEPTRDMEAQLGKYVYDPGEAIVVTPWLGRYDMVLPIEDEYQAPYDDESEDE